MLRQAMTRIPYRSPTGPALDSGHGRMPAGRAMTHNLAPWDRATRLVLGAALLYMAWTLLAGVAAVVVGGLGGVFLATGAAGMCPLYSVTGIGTHAPPGRP